MPMKTSNFGLGAHVLLATGIYALIGAAMIVPLFVPSRWRKRPASMDEEPIGMAAASSYLS
jgi:hydrogenase-4 membrane subunit HyfE